MTLDLVDYEPRDLVVWDGQAFAPWLIGAQIGIPAGVRIDALFIDNGSPVMSFDTPDQLDGTKGTPRHRRAQRRGVRPLARSLRGAAAPCPE